MRVYTEAHVMQVLILGLLNGVVLTVIFQTAAQSIRRARRMAKLIPLKSKIPTAGTSEYQIRNYSNY